MVTLAHIGMEFVRFRAVMWFMIEWDGRIEFISRNPKQDDMTEEEKEEEEDIDFED